MAKQTEKAAPAGKMRLDKWLNAARLFKTRSRAADFCQARHVKVNGKTAKPSQMIKIGDTISIQFPGRNRTIDVAEFAQRPLPAAAARELYEEHLPQLSEESSQLYDLFMKQERQRQRELKGKGRPTKKERRQLDKIKSK
jgi:ribosome-associated heat shock protein Hsp15